MAVSASKSGSHKWSFYRAGGVDQVRLDTGADIFAIDQLDQKLWVALSCPVKGLEFDARTLELLDLDKDAHVRPPEITAAVKWLREVLKSGDSLVAAKDGYALADLRDDTAEGKMLLAASKHVLTTFGKEKAGMLSVEDTTKTAEFFKTAKLNGDGIVPLASIDDADAQTVAKDLLACYPPSKDRSGQDGFDQKLLDQFFADCAAFDGWTKQSESDQKVLPFGTATGSAHMAVEAVRAKVDDYFARCRLAAFDPRALAALNLEEKAYLEVAAKDLTITAQEVAHFPLAMIEAGKPLPLTGAVNPAWAAAIQKLRDTCCKDKTALTEAEWTALCAKLEPFKAWTAGKAGAAVEKLGTARVRAILAGKSKAVLTAAVTADAAVAPEIDAIQKCEKLARLCRDFHKLLNNYVSFTDFYARRGAIFQAGTLFLDGRSLDLCFHVTDPAKHASMGPMAKTYLAYVDCSRPGGEKMTVACAFTAGDSDNLFAGRNGIFYDRKGRDWNATIAKVIDNPISIGQAFWSPYKKVLRFIEDSIAKRAAAADAEANAKLQATAADPKAAAADPKKSKFDVGIVAAIGVALGSLATAVSGFLAAFFGLGAWIPLGLVGIMLAISGPSMLIAWLKLRQRNLGPILDANGWAVNTLTKVNIPLGGSLTALPKLPEGSTRSLVDPYAPKASPWPKVFMFLFVVGVILAGMWRTNALYQLTGDERVHYVSDTIDGDHEIFEGQEYVILTLGRDNAFEVEVTIGDKKELVKVQGKQIKIPTKDAKVGTWIYVQDLPPNMPRPKAHSIEVKPKKP